MRKHKPALKTLAENKERDAYVTALRYLRAHIARGNKKLPVTTWIFNAGSARHCPSLALGLCQAGVHCYALKAETQYPAVFPYRMRQQQITIDYTPADMAAAILFGRTRPVSFRFNEAGDFIDQKQLNWFVELCGILAAAGISCYGYTARTDLDLAPLLAVASVNVSNDKGGWTSCGANRFRMVTKKSPKALSCPGSCKACTLCQRLKGQTIEIEKH